MIVRELKLRLNKTQIAELERWLYNLTSIYNWGLRKIELNAKDKIYFSKRNFANLLCNHSIKLDIPSHSIQGTLLQIWLAWNRCFKKISKKPRLKGYRNKFNSIPFPDPIRVYDGNRIAIPMLGKVRYYKQDLPVGKIKCGRIIKRASGWYLVLFMDAVHKFMVKNTTEAVGIDPGFSTLLTLSNGKKIENPRELRKGEYRLSQSQRAKDRRLAARLHERQKNRRKDRNHKISRKLIENYSKIYYSNDSFKNMASIFGKSISEASLGQLMAMITYKGSICGRDVVAVDSKYTTMTCSKCGAKTGPTGRDKLAVRHWECSACGVDHDRDINAAQVVFNVGAGLALKENSNVFN